MAKKLKKILLQLHRWTGLAMSFLFVVWFVSGFVMIYHTFPKPQTSTYFKTQNTLSLKDSIQSPHLLFEKHKVSAIVLEKVNNQAVFSFSGRGVSVYDAATLQPMAPLSVEGCKKVVQAHFSDPIDKVETINDYDQWIPWSHYKNHFPIQKIWLDDEKGTQVYVSSTAGRIVQETTSKSRVMAWLGAIPHWMYFKQLRLNAALWSDVVIWLSIIGCFVCLSGILVGFIRLKKRKKAKSWTDISPYKKKWFRWHHITGFGFGLFVFTFILSGLMSLADVPNWLVKKEKDINYYHLWNGSGFDDQQALQGFNRIIREKGASSIKKIICRKVMGRIFYEVYTNSLYEPECYIVDEDHLKDLPQFPELTLEKRMQDVLPQKQYSIQMLSEYTHYYTEGRRRTNPLPVYKIVLEDAYGTILYVNPHTGDLLKVLSRSSKWQWWLYQGLHTFNFSWFRQMEWLRQSWLILISIGGTIVSLSALVLGIKFFKRKMKRKKLGQF